MTKPDPQEVTMYEVPKNAPKVGKKVTELPRDPDGQAPQEGAEQPEAPQDEEKPAKEQEQKAPAADQDKSEAKEPEKLSERLMFPITPTMQRQVKELARQRGNMSIAAVCRQALAYYLEEFLK